MVYTSIGLPGVAHDRPSSLLLIAVICAAAKSLPAMPLLTRWLLGAAIIVPPIVLLPDESPPRCVARSFGCRRHFLRIKPVF